MPSAGNPCPLCKTVQSIAGPLCQGCLSNRVGFTARERQILIDAEPVDEYNQLMKRIDWWVAGPPGEATKLNSF